MTLVPFGVLVMRGPLVQVSLLGFEQNRFFTELAVPVRFGEDSGGRFVSGGFAIALGVVFM